MKILVTGGTGMVGSAFKNLETDHELILYGSDQYDLRDEQQVDDMFYRNQVDAVIHLAARVGGVKGNSDYVADFFYDNIIMNTNLLNTAKNHKVPKVLSLLSTCVYPDNVKHPLTEEQIHSGPPHQSNFGYAYAKRMLDVQSRALREQYGCNFICAVPNNLYGPYDNFNLETGHVIPSIIRKIWEAKLNSSYPTFWGDGSALREFTYSEDIAQILLFLLKTYNNPMPINIGLTNEYKISDIVQIVCECLKFDGDVIWDISKPTGQFRKPSSSAKLIEMGWKEEGYTQFQDGIMKTCEWFLDNYPNIRGLDK